MPRLRTGGAIPILSPHVFIAWTGTLIFITLYCFKPDMGEQKARIYFSCRVTDLTNTSVPLSLWIPFV
jgi:hypothetical protein